MKEIFNPSDPETPPEQSTIPDHEEGGMVDYALNQLDAVLVDTQDIPEELVH